MEQIPITNLIGDILPNKATLSSFAFIFLIIILVVVLVTVSIFWLLNHIKYNQKAIVFRKIGNQTIPAFTDKAIIERVGMGGDYWFRTKNSKKVLPRPKIQMAKNTYWLFERSDGEWINFSLEDLDEQMKKAKAVYVDEDMRLQRLGIQKNLDLRFKKVTFWERYGGMIVTIIYLLIVTICLVMLFNKMEQSWGLATEMSAAVRDMAVVVKNLQVRATSGALPVEAVSGMLIPLILPFGRKKWLIGN